MKYVNRSSVLLVVTACLALAVAPAHAELLITELSTKSAVNPEDYFELTNTGIAPVDITGWKFDDESGLLDEAVSLNGITSIAPGESVVFFQLDTPDPVADTATFRSYWGGLAGVQVGWHAGPGLGKGDGIVLFDASDAIAIELYYGYGDATDPDELLKDTHAGDWGAGNTVAESIPNAEFATRDMYEDQAAIWIPGTSPQQFTLAAPGVFGSFANTSGEYGSPGIVGQIPEPATLGLAALATLIFVSSRRKQS